MILRLLLVILISVGTYADFCAAKPQVGIAKKLGILNESETGDSYEFKADCRVLPNDSTKAIIAIADISEKSSPSDDSASYDLHLHLADTKSGRVLSQMIDKNAISSDAFRFEYFHLDMGLYILNPDTRAFGIRTRHNVYSSVVPAHDKILRLYIINGNGKIINVMEDLAVESEGFESSEVCTGSSRKHLTTISIGRESHNGFADLLLIQKSIETEEVLRKGLCEEKQKKKIKKFKLIFDGKRYPVPGGF